MSCSARKLCVFGPYPMCSKPLQGFDEKGLGSFEERDREQHVTFRRCQMKFSPKDYSIFCRLSEDELSLRFNE